jgi:hypothetical protein
VHGKLFKSRKTGGAAGWKNHDPRENEPNVEPGADCVLDGPEPVAEEEAGSLKPD